MTDTILIRCFGPKPLQTASLKALLAGLDYPHDVVGTIALTGDMNAVDFRDTSCKELAIRTDALIVWFQCGSAWPEMLTGEGTVLVNKNIEEINLFHHFASVMKVMVRGIELQTSRRVIAVGVEDANTTHWYEVPLDEESRWHGDTKNTPAVATMQSLEEIVDGGRAL